MRTSLNITGIVLLLAFSLSACVDALELNLQGTVDVIVVDGTLTNLPESQIIRLNRSRADPYTGRFGTLPITKAAVAVVVDSAQVVNCHETVDGSYQLPSDFRLQVGHAYQLLFSIDGGRQYASTQQIMPPVPPIDKIRAQFNPASLSGTRYAGIRAAHDLYVDVQDPADTRNYYRWDWEVYERQEWCRTCVQSVYSPNNVIIKSNGVFELYYRGTESFENCFAPPYKPNVIVGYFLYDYECRTQCWEIIYNSELNLFDDALTNGGQILNRRVAQIPFFQHGPCLVNIRQLSLTGDAYRYFNLFKEQTQNTGGLADTPPTALIGNVQNQANKQENVIGYFTVAAVSKRQYWLDRKDTEGTPPGLFLALNSRDPLPEPLPPNFPNIVIEGNPRPPKAVCVASDSRTPFKPDGWRE